MEHMGAMLEGGEWNHLSAMYTTHEEADFMAQLLNNCSAQVPNEQSLMYDHNNDAYSFSQGSNNYSNGSGILVPNSCQENYYLNESHQFLAMNNSSMSINFSSGEDKRVNSPPEVYTNPMMEMGGCLNREMSSGSLELSGGDLAEPAYEKKLQIRKSPEIPAPETQKKRSRVSGDVQKKRNVKTKKNQKLAVEDEDEDNNGGGVHGQNLTSCCSEEEDESNGGGASSGLTPFAAVLNSSGKTRASRGSATDPQSLYARKRRERINERLKVLQNLVPNGTKVDISTMLEEAVQYVKFLQLQIKLLSSDDMWMYAPLAYNGMDLGLDLKIGMHMPRSTS